MAAAEAMLRVGEPDGERLGLSVLEMLAVTLCEDEKLTADTLGRPDWEGELEYEGETLEEEEPLSEPVALSDPMVALALGVTVTDTERLGVVEPLCEPLSE